MSFIDNFLNAVIPGRKERLDKLKGIFEDLDGKHFDLKPIGSDTTSSKSDTGENIPSDDDLINALPEDEQKQPETLLEFQQQEAKRARRLELERQKKIKRGLKFVDAIFEGGEFKGKTYEGIEPIIKQRRQAMKQYYMPQLDQQFADAQEELVYSLARAGQLTSSTAGKKQSELGRKFAMEKGNILSQIAADLADTRNRAQSERSTIEGGLRSTADASGAVNSALAGVAKFAKEQPTINPLGHVFHGLTSGIGSAKSGYDAGKISFLSNPNTNPFTSSDAAKIIGG